MSGNQRIDYEKLLSALKEIADSYGVGIVGEHTPRSFDAPIPEIADVPTEADLIPLYESEGRVVYDPIITYPPGTPVVCPGEIMSMEVIGYIQDLLENGDRISGVDEEGMIKVGL